MIGNELENKTELFEWFLKQKNKTINGFNKVIYSGITTTKMAEIVIRLIDQYSSLSGIYNISSKPISKFELLKLWNDYFDINANIEIDNIYTSNKNLISDNFYNIIRMEQPDWVELSSQLKIDNLLHNNLYN